MKNSDIKISIIAPVYNVADYLQDSIGSVLNQSLHNIEIIAIDDGSTDDSLSVLFDIAQSDDRLKVIHQQNTGAAAARNEGIKQAEGKYLYFLDPDDYMEETMLEHMYTRAEEQNAQLIISGFVNEYYEKGKSFSTVTSVSDKNYNSDIEFRSDAYIYLNNTMLAVPWNKLYLKEYLKNNNIQFPSGVKWDDLHFNIEAVKDIEKVSIISNSEYHFLRSRPGSETTRVFDNSLFAKRKEQFNHILEVFNYWSEQGSTDLHMDSIYYYFASRIVQVVQEVSGNKNMSVTEKKNFIKKIVADKLVDESLEKQKSDSKSMALLIWTIKTKNTFLILTIGKLIGFIKDHFARLFYLQKKHTLAVKTN